jgi:hypothetical protein
VSVLQNFGFGFWRYRLGVAGFGESADESYLLLIVVSLVRVRGRRAMRPACSATGPLQLVRRRLRHLSNYIAVPVDTRRFSRKAAIIPSHSYLDGHTFRFQTFPQAEK